MHGKEGMHMKSGLVLEGGAMRGLFSTGVIDVMMEQGVTFDGLAGVSAGAAFGCNYKSGQAGRAVRYNTRFCKDRRYCSMRSLLLTGNIFGAEFCYHTIPNELDPFDKDAFDASPMAFYVVCTDALTGKAVYHRCDKAGDDCYEWIRASASMPLVSRPVVIGDSILLDGGIADSIPLGFMLREGYARNVVVLTQPRDFVKQPASLMGLMELRLRNYPKLLEAVKHRHEDYNRSRELVFSQEKQGSAFVICPDEPLPIGRIEHDADTMRRVYQIGRETAERCMEELKRFLQ